MANGSFVGPEHAGKVIETGNSKHLEYRTVQADGSLTYSTAADFLTVLALRAQDPTYVGREAERTMTRWSETVAAAEAAQGAVDAHEANYTGWARYFLVTSSPGHVHSSLHCSTCRATTTFAPVVTLSGCDEPEAVELVGDTLCAVCFPSVKGKPGKLTAAQARKLAERSA